MKNQQLRTISEYERPLFHLTPEIGWMNDPNGFSWYQGKYHLFYQCYPLATNWGPTRWGHAVSDDLIRWERLPVALTPEEEYETFGCFSGTAVDAGRHMLMYTGCRLDPDDDKGRGFQTQCMAFGDGRNYEKFSGNPVITADALPEGSDPYEFRDPKLWIEQDRTFRAVIASHHEKRGAQILLFRSDDGLRWEFVKVLLRNLGKPGWMWECPDFFPLEGRQVLIVSTMGEVEALCLIGEYDRESETFHEITWHNMEQGFDFYGGETMLAPDGRRILIGWMQNPATAENRDIDFPNNGQRSIPRELYFRGDRLMQRPVRELAEYREDEIIYRNVKLGENSGAGEPEDIHLDGICGRTVDMEISIRPDEDAEGGQDTYRLFRMRFAKDEEHYTEFTYEPQTSVATIDRSHSGPGRTKLVRKQTPVRSRNGQLDIRLILDRLSAELFINDGEHVMSAVIYTDRHAEDITFYVDGAAVMDIAKYRMKENK